MIAHPFIKSLAEQKKPIGSGDVLRCSIRLIRNFASVPFPDSASSVELELVLNLVRSIFKKLELDSLLSPVFEIPFSELSEVDFAILDDRDLIPREHDNIPSRTIFFCAEDGSFSALVNATDHLDLRFSSPGSDIRTINEHASVIDDALASCTHIMFSSRYGYLTASPDHVGTAFHASFTLHLPALNILDEFNRRADVLRMIGLVVVPCGTRPDNPTGSLWKITNISTIGDTRDNLLNRVIDAKNWLLVEEKRFRRNALAAQPLIFLNPCSRAYGLLKYAQLLSDDDLLNGLSMLKLGADCGFFTTFDSEDVARFRADTMPGKIMATASSRLTPVELASLRATVLRNALGGPDYTLRYRPD